MAVPPTTRPLNPTGVPVSQTPVAPPSQPAAPSTAAILPSRTRSRPSTLYDRRREQQERREKDTARQLEEQQRAAERVQKEQDAHALKVRNAEAESRFRKEGRPFYTDEFNHIVPTHTDDEWQALQAQKQQEEQKKAAHEAEAARLKNQFEKEGRRYRINPVTDLPEATQSDEDLAAEREKAAADLRSDHYTTEAKKIRATLGDPQRKPLTQTERDRQDRKLSDLRKQGAYAIQTRLQQQSKAQDIGSRWNPFDNQPTPEATAAQERLQNMPLDDKGIPQLDEQSLAELAADPEFAELAKQITELESGLAVDDENRSFHQDAEERLFSLELRRDNPEEWKKREAERRANLSPDERRDEIQKSGASFLESRQAYEEELETVTTEQQAFVDQVTDLEEQNAVRIAGGLPAEEIVEVDGEPWARDLAADLFRVHADAQDWTEQNRDRFTALEQRRDRLNEDAAALNAAHADATAATNEQREAELERLEQNPLTRELSQSLRALDADHQARLDALNGKYPDGSDSSPEAQAAFDALDADVEQQREALHRSQEEIAGKARAFTRDFFRTLNPAVEYSAGAGKPSEPHLKGIIARFAEKHGLTAEEGEAILAETETADFSKGNTDDTARILPSGSIAVNPTLLLDEDAYRAAVAGSGATDEAQQAALDRYPELRKEALQELLPILSTTTRYQNWLAKQSKRDPAFAQLHPTEQADRYRQTRGWTSKFLDQITTGYYTGVLGAGQAIYGIVGALGSDAAAEASRKYQPLLQYEAERLQASGATDGFGLQFSGQLAQAVPSLAVSLGAGIGAQATVRLGMALTGVRSADKAHKILQAAGIFSAAAAGGAQTGGAMFAELYDHGIEAGLTPEAARREALVPTLAAGLVTASLTLGFGATGAESILRSQEARSQIVRTWAQALRKGGIEALKEMPEEALDEAFSTLIQNSELKGDADLASVLEAGLTGGAIGGILGGFVGLYGAVQEKNGPEFHLRPETRAAAEAAIDGLQIEEATPDQILISQRVARTLLAIGQGDIGVVDDEHLALVGLERDGAGSLKTAKASADGTPPRVVIEQGQPIITQAALDRLEARLPAVREAIAADEVTRRQQVNTDASEDTPASPAPRSGTPTPEDSSAAAPQATSSTEPATEPTPESTTESATTAPDKTGTEADDEAREKRTAELTSYLAHRGLPEEQARQVAAYIVQRQGIVGKHYNEQASDSDFVEALKAVGVSGSLSRKTLKAPDDLSTRVSQASTPTAPDGTPAGPQASETAAPGHTDTPAAPEGDSSGGITGQTETGPVSQSSVETADGGQDGASTPPVGGPGFDVDAFTEAVRQTKAAAPVADRKEASRRITLFEQVLARFAPAFKGKIRFVTETSPAALRTGAGVSIAEDGTLHIDLPRLIDQASDVPKRKQQSYFSRTLIHELIHTAAKPKLDGKLSRDIWSQLPAKLRRRVYASYYAVDIRNAAGEPLSDRALLQAADDLLAGKRDDLPEAGAYHMAHELVRMLVEDSAFKGEVTEAMDADPRLGKQILDFLNRVLAEIRKLLDTETPPEVRTELQVLERQIGAEVKALIKALPKAGDVKAAQKKQQEQAKDLSKAGDQRQKVTKSTSEPETPRGDFNPLAGVTSPAYTDGNESINLQWAVADVGDVNVSNRDDGTINPDYPQELQPRDRTSASSEAQVQDIATNANLDRLSISATVGDGAPIVGPDGVVESGNGRVMGLRRSYTRRLDSSAAYKEALMARAMIFGLDPSAIGELEHPILVRIRKTEVDRVAFVLSANVGTIAPKRELEQAKTDARQIVPDLFESFVPAENGDIFHAANADFIRTFVSAIVPPAERGAVIDARGNLTQSGLRRLRNALFVHAYGDNPEALNALARLTEEIGGTGTQIVQALLAAAPRFAELNARMENGALYPLSITEDLSKAVQTLQDLRNRDEKLADFLSQQGLPGIEEGPTELQKELLRFLDENANAPRRLMQAFARYASAVEGAGDPRQIGLFGDTQPTREELWNLATAPQEAALNASSRKVAPENALKVYRKLKKLEATKGLDATQHQTLRQVEAALGQTFLFDDADLGTAPAPFVLQQQTTEQPLATTPEQTDQLSLLAPSRKVEEGPDFEVQTRAIRAIHSKLHGPRSQTSQLSQRTGQDGTPWRELASRASRFIGGNARAGDPRTEAARDAGATLADEKALLVDWAREEGLLISRLPEDWTPGHPSDLGQEEHHVFLTEDRVVKITREKGFGNWPVAHEDAWDLQRRAASPYRYLTRILASNRALEDDIVLHGVYADRSGAVQIITSQPRYRGIALTALLDPSLPEGMADDYTDSVAAALQEDGFLPAGDDRRTYYNPDTNQAVFDAHLGNIIHVETSDEAFELQIFDAIVTLPTGRLRQNLRKAVGLPPLHASTRKVADNVVPYSAFQEAAQEYFDFHGTPEATANAGIQTLLQFEKQQAASPYSQAAHPKEEHEARRQRAARRFYALFKESPQYLREELDADKSAPFSSLLHDLIQDKTHSFDIRGAIIRDAMDFHAFALATRTPYFESLKIAVLGNGDQVLHSEVLTIGRIGEVAVPTPRLMGVVQRARMAHPEARVDGFIISHNHPSGSPDPSDADFYLTKKLSDLSRKIGVPFLDHIITNGESYYSFREMGHHSLKFNYGPAETGSPLLPILERPERLALAEWETVANSMRPIISDPEQGQVLFHNLATADPYHHHLIYQDTRLRVRAVERVPAGLGQQELLQRAVLGADREGASSILFSPSSFRYSAVNDPDLIQTVHGLRDTLPKADLELTDTAFLGRDRQHHSFKLSGLLAPSRKVQDDSTPDLFGQQEMIGHNAQLDLGDLLTPEQQKLKQETQLDLFSGQPAPTNPPPAEEAPQPTDPEPIVPETAPEALTLTPTQDAISDFGQVIPDARKHHATKPQRSALPKEKPEQPGWRRKYLAAEVLHTRLSIQRSPGDLGKPTGKWTVIRKDGVRVRAPEFDTKAEAEAIIPIIEVTRNHGIMPARREEGKAEEWVIYRQLGKSKRPTVKGGFSTREEAQKFMALHPEQIIEHKFKLPTRPWLDRLERKGGTPREENVTTTMFQETFGFRGGQFGNWNKGGDGQAALNAAYDALLDFADLLGVPPKALSLNGELAIAFGARGRGGKNAAAAHYEPQHRVINLTKINGAGSLAHEWFHALDHYLGRQDGSGSGRVKRQQEQGRDPDFVRHEYGSHGFSTTGGVREELRTAFTAVMASLTAKKVEKAITVHPKREQSVTKEVESLLQRLREQFTTYHQYNRRKKKTPATEEQLQQWDALAERILDLNVGDRIYVAGKGRYSIGRESYQPIQDLNALYKSVIGSSFDTAQDHAAGKRLYWAIRSAIDTKARIAQAAEGQTEMRTISTEFLRNAREIDQYTVGNYWSSPHEMAARAFEAYVEDRIADLGRQNDYLSYGADNRFYVLEGMKPYPAGEERQTFNAAWDTLISTLRTEPTPDGGQRLYAPTRKVTAEQDAAYLQAVESGDLTTAQRMVDEAAEIAGYTIGPVYHGTDAQFDVFQLDADGFAYFADRDHVAAEYGEHMIRTFLRIQNPIRGDYEDWAAGMADSAEQTLSQGYDGVVIDEFDSNWIGSSDVTAYAITNPAQAKSAEAVVRDASGAVVPLSQRFDPSEETYLRAPSRRVDQTAEPLFGLQEKPAKMLDGLLIGMDAGRAADFAGIEATRQKVESIARSLGELIANYGRIHGLTPEEAQRTLAERAAYLEQEYAHEEADPHTGAPSLITGPRVSAAQSSQISSNWTRSLRRGLREGPEGGSVGRVLQGDRARAFEVPALTRPQAEALYAATEQIGEGAESVVYADRKKGVVYKRLRNGHSGTPTLGLTPRLSVTSELELDWKLEPAERPRELAARIAVMTHLGGTPTEIAGVDPDGHVLLKQPLSPTPDVRDLPRWDAKLWPAAMEAGFVLIPEQLRGGTSSPAAYLVHIEGHTWFLTDTRYGNQVGDHQGDTRYNDIIVGHAPDEILRQVPGLTELAEEARQKAETLGDRSHRLFAPSRKVNPAARLGWNHLDRALTDRVAAVTAAVNEKTGLSETLTRWTDAPNIQPFKEAARLIQRELLPDTAMPREALAEVRQMNIKAAMGAERAMDLVRALSGSPKFSDLSYPKEFAKNPEHRRRLYWAMAGEIPLDSLPPPLQALGRKLRGMLVNIGQEAVKQGRMSMDTFDGLREHYMPRFYKEEAEAAGGNLWKRFKLGVKDILAQRTTAFHVVDTEKKDTRTGEHALVSWDDQGRKWRFRTQEHRDAWFEDFIQRQALDRLQSRSRKNRALTIDDLRSPHGLDAETRGRFMEIQATLRRRYEKRAPLSLQEQEDAGVIADPVYAISRYAAQMAHDNSTAEFFNFVAQNPDWQVGQASPGFKEIPDNPRFGRLAGTWVREDIAGQVLELADAPNAAIALYDGILRMWKTGKTVLNPGTHVRNLLGNLFFSQFAGTAVHNPANLPYYLRSLKALRKGGEDLTELFEQGVLGGDFVRTELRQVLRGLLPDAATVEQDPTVLMRIGMILGKAVPRFAKTPLQSGMNVATALYQAEDELFKAAAYFKALDMGMEPKAAAAHVRHWFPYYDGQESATLRGLKRTAMPFLSFYRESLRIFTNALRERPLALAAGLSIPSIVTALSALALGLDEEDEEQVKQDLRGKGGKLLGPFLSDHPVFSMLLPARTADGHLQQYDLSAVHPFADFLGQRVDMGRENRPWWQLTLRHFISAGPIGSLLYAGTTGRDSFGDRNVWEADMSETEKAAAMASHAWTTLVPPLAPGGTSWKMLEAAGTRTTNKTLEKRDPAQAALRAFAGLDVRNANPNLYRLAEDFRAEQGLERDPTYSSYGTTAVSRARAALFAELAQDAPDRTLIRQKLEFLRLQGVPINDAADVNRLLFYKDPAKLIGGDQRRGIDAPTMQQHWRHSLTGEARRVLEEALTEYRQIQAKAPALLLAP